MNGQFPMTSRVLGNVRFFPSNAFLFFFGRIFFFNLEEETRSEVERAETQCSELPARHHGLRIYAPLCMSGQPIVSKDKPAGKNIILCVCVSAKNHLCVRCGDFSLICGRDSWLADEYFFFSIGWGFPLFLFACVTKLDTVLLVLQCFVSLSVSSLGRLVGGGRSGGGGKKAEANV